MQDLGVRGANTSYDRKSAEGATADTYDSCTTHRQHEGGLRVRNRIFVSLLETVGYWSLLKKYFASAFAISGNFGPHEYEWVA